MMSHTLTDNNAAIHLLRRNISFVAESTKKGYLNEVIWFLTTYHSQSLPQYKEPRKMSSILKLTFRGQISSSRLHGLRRETTSKINKEIREKGGIPKKKIQEKTGCQGFSSSMSFLHGFIFGGDSSSISPQLYGSR